MVFQTPGSCLLALLLRWVHVRNSEDMHCIVLQKIPHAKKQQGTLAKATAGAMLMSAATVGLNILQDMNKPVFEMKFESLPPASKVGYRLVLLIIPEGQRYAESETLFLFWQQQHAWRSMCIFPPLPTSTERKKRKTKQGFRILKIRIQI